jgi:phosphoglycolate phosphatase
MEESRLPRAVIFDFDLTLADSSAAVAECVSYALHSLGLPQPGSERIRRTIGLSLEEGLELLTGETDSETRARYRELFVQHADKVMVGKTVLMEGTRGTLDFLRGHGILTGIVSTKYRYRIEAILDRQDILEQIDKVVGGEDVAAVKPDPEGLKLALKDLGVAPGHAAFVGDHLVDAEAASRAGIPFIGLLSGTTRESEFHAFPHLAVLPSVADVPERLLSIGSP